MGRMSDLAVRLRKVAQSVYRYTKPSQPSSDYSIQSEVTKRASLDLAIEVLYSTLAWELAI